MRSRWARFICMKLLMTSWLFTEEDLLPSSVLARNTLDLPPVRARASELKGNFDQPS
ncbi:MAG: hypothetical protein Ct9H300mP15_09470 [Gemmatimonadota bacterium]|nr:MAG: hypothetical protein Ct9H300mP15_09470 [Gemmatimonadota bacterium]